MLQIFTSLWWFLLNYRTAGIGKVVVYSEGASETLGGASLDEGATLKFSPDAEFYIGGVPPTVEVSKFQGY